MKESYNYVVIGAGLTGSSTVSGIRDIDKRGSVLMIGDESYRPYHRPPLTKGLWSGKKSVEDIFVDSENFYEENSVVLRTGEQAISIDSERKIIKTASGNAIQYEKLMLATGGRPRKLSIPGGDLESICYYRYLDDYLRMRSVIGEDRSVLVIGGGFIGSELASSLSQTGLEVTLLFTERLLCSKVFPSSLGKAIMQNYRNHGIRMLSEDRPISICKRNGTTITVTSRGNEIESDFVVVGIGITPDTVLAKSCGLQTGNGVIVDEYLQTSNKSIYAAGDNTIFPYKALGRKMRLEHWDNALNQGRWAGRNMAGSHEKYSYMPYFFSDLFTFGYEAVGDINSELPVVTDWKKENDTGIIYYLNEGKITGVMNCNVWGKIDLARELITAEKIVNVDEINGLIPIN